MFRGATLSAAGKRANDKIRDEMEEFVRSCQEDADALMRKNARREGTNEGLDPNDPNQLLGRTVLMPGSHWGEPGRWYVGKVLSYGPKQRGRKRKFYKCR